MKEKSNSVIRTAVFCMLVLMFTIGFGTKAFASSAKITFSVSSNNICVDDKVTVTMQISSDEKIPGSFEGYISYNAEVLSYTGGPDFVAGGEGLLKITDPAYEEQTARRSYELEFTAIARGYCEIGIKGTPELYEYDEGYLMSVSGNRITINVNPGIKASKDASVGTLKVSPGTLSPAFSNDEHEYSISVDNEVTKLFVSAVPNDEKATVTIEGNEDLKEGQNRVVVRVTAEDGTENKFVIYTVRRRADEVVPDSKENETQINEPAISNNTGWGFYASKDDNGTLMLTADTRYVICDSEEGITIPDGYYKTSIIISGFTVRAYSPKEDMTGDFLLLILKKEGSEPGLYSYDRVEKTLQRYNAAYNGSHVTYSKYASLDEQALAEGYEKSLGTLTVVIAVLCGVCMALLIVTIRFALKSRQKGYDELD